MKLNNIASTLALSALALFASCEKQDLGENLTPENYPQGSVPININLLNDGDGELTRSTITNSNIDKYYLQINQEDETGASGTKYDYCVMMKREYKGTGDFRLLAEVPSADWGEWQMYDVNIVDGNPVISTTPRTEPMYYYSLGKDVEVHAAKWDALETKPEGAKVANTSTINDETGFFYSNTTVFGLSSLLRNDGGKAVFTTGVQTFFFMGSLTPEQLYQCDHLSTNISATLKKPYLSNGKWNLDVSMDHNTVRVRIEVEFTGNYKNLFDNYNTSAGIDENVIKSLNIKTVTADAVAPAKPNRFDAIYQKNFKGNAGGGGSAYGCTDLVMTPVSFGLKEGKWIAVYETLLGQQQKGADDVNDFNFHIDITTSQFSVDTDTGTYSIDPSKNDRQFRFTTTDFSSTTSNSHSINCNVQLGDEYSGDPY